MKRIIICCDGTWNSPGDVEQGTVIKTNVQKLFEGVCNIDQNNILQLKYYTEGVGTSGGKLRRVIDGATGWGLDDHILNAYKFLVWNFIKGDEIYIFGFSRGAYTARSLAGLIRNCGIIRNDDLNLINEAYEHYRNRTDRGWKPNGQKAMEFKAKYSQETGIKFIGVWDTVGALGIPFSFFRLYNKNRYKFHDTKLSTYVDYAYHAVAIDERRASFKPTLWTQSKSALQRPTPQILEQRWFSGVHSNIGGGYPDSSISDITFKWMAEKATETGLAFEERYLTNNIKPNIDGKLYNSFVFPFNLMPPAKRIISANQIYHQTVDPSAIEIWKTNASYRPQNLKHVIEKGLKNDEEIA
ncbi:DUF2235 domain-containing protein [Mucilaginibacter aquaedulcis]|uniref:DUF2235 domain-containing protein n=1 Tax=Mucilaginibacter aquaedulcis TaxID=1187081 RepID=UPI0025B488A9|nr:DUF2235 domain-containing protein [Mucilaginibacter aquaedulcis]MDN3547365.1 DUF2235 domain-containing protein [Mucilaginibacter aquaedulcis]